LDYDLHKAQKYPIIEYVKGYS